MCVRWQSLSSRLLSLFLSLSFVLYHVSSASGILLAGLDGQTSTAVPRERGHCKARPASSQDSQDSQVQTCSGVFAHYASSAGSLLGSQVGVESPPPAKRSRCHARSHSHACFGPSECLPDPPQLRDLEAVGLFGCDRRPSCGCEALVPTASAAKILFGGPRQSQMPGRALTHMPAATCFSSAHPSLRRMVSVPKSHLDATQGFTCAFNNLMPFRFGALAASRHHGF